MFSNQAFAYSLRTQLEMVVVDGTRCGCGQYVMSDEDVGHKIIAQALPECGAKFICAGGKVLAGDVMTHDRTAMGMVDGIEIYRVA
jgi:hypothetical protein